MNVGVSRHQACNAKRTIRYANHFANLKKQTNVSGQQKKDTLTMDSFRNTVKQAKNKYVFFIAHRKMNFILHFLLDH